MEIIMEAKEITTLQVEQSEVLRYLRWPMTKPLPPDLANDLAQAEAAVLAAAQPRFVYKQFALLPEDDVVVGRSLQGASLRLAGRDIACLLRGCSACLLLAASLGRAVDELIRRAQIRDVGQALLLDACASAAVENLLEQLQAGLTAELQEQGWQLTARFSPGYGDLPLDCQAQFCATLDAARRIGLTVSSSGLLLPRKSVTAVIGLAQQELRAEQRDLSRHNCAACRLLDCPYRRK